MIDIHTHLWLARHKSPRPADEPLRAVTWPARVARDNSADDMEETYRLMFPGKSVTPLVFGNMLSAGDDERGGNEYVGASAAARNWPALLFTNPNWSAAELERRLDAGKFLGSKSYLTLSPAYLPEKEIRIYDFFPHHQLEALDRRRALLMLHIPRDGRLRDPVNLAQMLEIEERYPALQVIVAHVGRAYCPEDVGNAFETLARTRRMCFDFSANTNEDVFRRLIAAVGPARVLFGSDLPITRMRMRRICESGNYVNIVPRGLYGDVSGDGHMREVDGAEAERLTFFMYEELDAFRRASEREGLSRTDIEAVFRGNAERLIAAARR
jgi:predicted TIM-barrel fold metal-dependent hydrolase